MALPLVAPGSRVFVRTIARGLTPGEVCTIEEGGKILGLKGTESLAGRMVPSLMGVLFKIALRLGCKQPQVENMHFL